MVTTDEVMAAVSELEQALTTTELSLDDLPQAITNRNVAAIKTVFADGEEDVEAISKWFTHYVDGEQHDSAVDTLTVTNDADEVEYVLVESELHSNRKNQHNQDGMYHARWVVGKDDSVAQEYFIHRLDWQRGFEDGLDAIDNPMQAVRSWLGFDEYLPTDFDDVEYKTWYQVQGDIAIRFRSLNQHIQSTAKNNKDEALTAAKKEAFEQWESEDGSIQTHDDISVSISSFGGLNVRLNCQTDTETLKTLQDDLDFAESDIRDKMRDSWKQLTAGRRESIIERLVKNKIADYIESRTPDTVDLMERFEEEARTALKEDATQQNFIIGNHLLICDRAVEIRPQRGVEVGIAIPEASNIYFVHDEHTDKSRRFEEVVIEVKVLDRHENA